MVRSGGRPMVRRRDDAGGERGARHHRKRCGTEQSDDRTSFLSRNGCHRRVSSKEILGKENAFPVIQGYHSDRPQI